MQVAIQVPAFKEPELWATLDAIADQPVPPFVDHIEYEAWITPDGDPVECMTFQQAMQHPTFEAYEAPKYKLPTRNRAHTSAVDRGFDTFVTWDADAPPVREETLTNLLTRLQNPETVAVCAYPVAKPRPVGFVASLGVNVKEMIGGMHGQCHAVTADAWEYAGPFKENIDQTDIAPVWIEEEMRFGIRLRQIGKVEYAKDAPVRNDVRRLLCKYQRTLRRPMDPYCEKPEGEDTFAPREGWEDMFRPR